jgi:hypothetical protein
MNIDESITATCTIIKGDLPIKIWWQFSEVSEDHLQYNLTTNDGVVITKPSPKISILAIDAVKARHRGNYTCFAKNNAGIVQHSAFLFVNGKTLFIVIKIIESSSFAICFTSFLFKI